ncbi:uncharacterized protein GIQ15_00108 [Arthroderma uncinatum]|uniref:uncharacterized protein n=1 Tax=Arthroderma uncinatum TaxID=74035 RepID=UPI00144AEA62|nr:uncharacterized protein GIQ15_00108 [Arthroderma uncinatum]KAF3490591.1 hypothetical protein GIQ15_00108 [Arthroderma uncinatum]
MFEGFSFPAPPSPPLLVQPNSSLAGHHDLDSLQFQCDSNLVSPLSSRCPSPRLPSPLNSRDFPRLNRRSRQYHHYHHHHLGPAPTSIPADYSPDRGQRFSIGTLTKQLHAHSLETGGSHDISSDSDDGRWLPITPPRYSTDAEYQNFAVLSSQQQQQQTPSQSLQSSQPPHMVGVEGLVHGSSAYYSVLDSASPPPSPKDPHARRFSLPDDHKKLNLPLRNKSPNEIFYSTPHSRSSIVNTVVDDTDSAITTAAAAAAAEEGERSSDVRYQREKFSMLQCASSSIADTVRLAILLDGDIDHSRDLSSYGSTGGEACDSGYLSDDQHPSSLPPSRTPSRKRLIKPKPHTHSPTNGYVTSSRFSGTGGKGKVEKSHHNHHHHHHHNHHNGTGTSTLNSNRKFGKSQYGLRRKSLLLAAVTAVLEQEVAEMNQMKD